MSHRVKQVGAAAPSKPGWLLADLFLDENGESVTL